MYWGVSAYLCRRPINDVLNKRAAIIRVTSHDASGVGNLSKTVVCVVLVKAVCVLFIDRLVASAQSAIPVVPRSRFLASPGRARSIACRGSHINFDACG